MAHETLDREQGNYLMGVVREDGRIGLGYIDISTGEFRATELESDEEVLTRLHLGIAELYEDRIAAENIVVFPGAQTGMTLTARALLNEGDHAVIVTPSYQSLEEGPKLAGCEITDRGCALRMRTVEPDGTTEEIEAELDRLQSEGADEARQLELALLVADPKSPRSKPTTTTVSTRSTVGGTVCATRSVGRSRAPGSG